MGASLFVVSVAQSGPTNTTASATKSKGADNATAKSSGTETNKLEIAKSVFVIPKDSKAGKDPFFPRSPYPYSIGVPQNITKTTTVPVVVTTTLELTLSGLSGTDEKPLAIINFMTFGVGDEQDVPVAANKKVRVRCFEINLAEKTAVVSANGRLQTLSLKQKK